mmetsp:Transcript_2839/g.3937  ORF Transcript_2839/g.3937 Transcript_2839/m.3937 type:complete len:427 (-) Transcript_2839:214-1494(-)
MRKECISEPCASGVALVTTLLLPEGGAHVLLSFVRWHLAIGFERLYLFFDDFCPKIVGWDELKEMLKSIKDGEIRVECYRRGEIDWKRNEKFSPFVDTEVQARQVLNAEYAYVQAMTAGLRWLLHLDIDEAFYVSSRSEFVRHFAQLDADNIGHCTYANHEGVPEYTTHETIDYFAHVTLFRVNHLCPQGDMNANIQESFAYWKQRTRHSQFLLCYDNGKSAVRLVQGSSAISVHAWNIPSNLKYRTALTDARKLEFDSIDYNLRFEPCILHYVVCGLFWLETKYKVLGHFDNAWFGGALPIAPSFHLDARDIVLSNDPLALHSFYNAHVAPPPPHILNKHIEAGVCRRYFAISTFLKQFALSAESTLSSSSALPQSISTSFATKEVHNVEKNADNEISQQSQVKNNDKFNFERAWILSTAAQQFL